MSDEPYRLISRTERMALQRTQQRIIHHATLDNIHLSSIQMKIPSSDKTSDNSNIEMIDDALDTVDSIEINQPPDILPTTIIDDDCMSTYLPIIDDYANNNNEYDRDVLDEPTHQEVSFGSETASFSPSTTELAVMLSFFRHRHKITKTCLTDLCKLLNKLDITNAPVDCRAIERILAKDQETAIIGKMVIMCFKCHTKGTNSDKCENKMCTDHQQFSITPTSIITFKLLPQLTAILERQSVDAFISSPDNQSTDITDRSVYKSLLMAERAIEANRQIITLLLNTDGVLVKQINRSIWISCVAINELPRRVRFKQENLIICSVSIGEQKPKKEAFQSMISDWINELIQLEYGFYISPPHLPNQLLKIHVYLLAATMDKPAFALLTNLNDSNGFYSCAHCTIQGKSVPTRHGTVRTFIREKTELIYLRNNDLYDIHLKNLSDRNYCKTVSGEVDLACGQLGSCSLRQLKYFQIGKSFCCDSLHNIYSGVFKRLMTCWFKSRGRKYSIHKSLHSVEEVLDSMKFPSTTCRLPSRLRHWSTFKGNEYRITLLFGYIAFKDALPPTYYAHLRLLAFAMNIAELNYIDDVKIRHVRLLLEDFDRLFPILYSENEITSVVHSVCHVADCLEAYGPVQNYSTFNFESCIGTIVSALHGPNLILQEFTNNLNMIINANAKRSMSSFDGSANLFIEQLFASNRCSLPTILEEANSTNDNVYIRLSKPATFIDNNNLNLFLMSAINTNFTTHQTCWIKQIKFSAYTNKINGKTSDSCVIYRDNDTNNIGFIMAIIKEGEYIQFVVMPATLIHYDQFHLRRELFTNISVIYGQFTNKSDFQLVPYTHLLLKVVFKIDHENKCTFFIFPNTTEST